MKSQSTTNANTPIHHRSHDFFRPFLVLVLFAVTVTVAAVTTAEIGLAQGTEEGATVGTGLTAVSAPDLEIGFSAGKLAGASITNPTSLQFGPDDRLYVSEQKGLIKAYTITRAGPTAYTATLTETISLVQSIPNHNDDGSLARTVTERQVTGILVSGTAANPVLYVSSSDPRITVDGKNPPSASADTNSGVVSRLRWDGSSWNIVDLVRGLPRSRENHSVNGMALDEATNTLYLMVGGNTNMGAPSTNFTRLPEFALSAALLTIDLDAIGDTTYDLPTLDDEDRPGTTDANDPFGGNLGKNQAIIDPSGPVQIYSPGWRNAYDVVLHSSGELYTVDNGSNAGWGGTPTDCLNTLDDGGRDETDILQHIRAPGYYGGHPNPTRGNLVNTFNSTNPQSPVPAVNAVECNYINSGDEAGALTAYGFSTNGLVEYTASNFSGALQGNLLTATYAGHIWRMQLNSSGDALLTPKELLLSGFDTHALDVTAQPDEGIFPGTIWVATYFNGPIWVFEPKDEGVTCAGNDDANVDDDGDGYDNADEIDNGTNPCSAGSLPPDYDGDKTSDLNDPDDDGDGIIDSTDLFALDRSNGADTSLPVILNWNNGDPNPGGILNLGFTGLMNNGSNYADLYDAEQIVPSGAAGIVTLNNVPGGDAYGSTNSQQYGFQFGINVDDSDSSFTIHTRVKSPFAGKTLQDTMSVGTFIGSGDQDNYLKLVVSANGGVGGVQVVLEEEGTVVTDETYGPTDGVNIVGVDSVDLMIHVNPAAGQATLSIAVNEGAQQWLGSVLDLPQGWFAAATKPAVGIIATSAGATSFPASWDFLTVTETPNMGPSKIYLPFINRSGAESSATATDGQQPVRAIRSAPIRTVAVHNFVPNTFSLREQWGQTPLAVNAPPVANPGSPQVVVDADNNGTELVQLTGGGSYDPDAADGGDGEIVSYAWSSSSGVEIPPNPNPLVEFPVGTHAITLTVTDNSEETNTKSIAITVMDPISTPIYYRVNAGGGVTPPSDSSEVTWSGDNFLAKSPYLTGADLRTYVTTTTVEIDDASLQNTAITEGMMRAERYLHTDDEPGQVMSWDFPLEEDTPVEVRIYLAEIWFNEPDQRNFSISIEGGTPSQFSEIKMFEQFGFHHAVMLTHTVTVADGNLDIDFTSILENPAVKAIEIVEPGTVVVRSNILYLPVILKQE